MMIDYFDTCRVFVLLNVVIMKIIIYTLKVYTIEKVSSSVDTFKKETKRRRFFCLNNLKNLPFFVIEGINDARSARL